MEKAQVMQSIAVQITPLLGQVMANSSVRAQCESLGIAGPEVTPEQVEALLVKLAGAMHIFIGREKTQRVMSGIRASLGAHE
ncbi:MAG TPA: hypothetical protein VEZ11_01470 [Thermoanaerobaculia bacterium]|nr:hypothetical protein [Thermoanaerobaculia bacterium]